MQISCIYQQSIFHQNIIRKVTCIIHVIWAIAKGKIPIVGITKEKYLDDLYNAVMIKLLPEEIESLERIASETGLNYKGAWEKRK